jgi:hypothetical protein
MLIQISTHTPTESAIPAALTAYAADRGAGWAGVRAKRVCWARRPAVIGSLGLQEADLSYIAGWGRDWDMRFRGSWV